MTTNEQMAKSNSGKKLSPLKSIKAYCRYHCCNNEIISWKECSFTNCYLFKYRLGKGSRKQASILHNLSKKPHQDSSQFKIPIPSHKTSLPGSQITSQDVQAKLGEAGK